MKEQFLKIVSRLYAYPAHCQARLRSSLASTFFYTINTFSSNWIKTTLKTQGLSLIPALLTFLTYLLSLCSARASNTTGFDSNRIETTARIREVFNEHQEEASIYLEKHRIKPEIITSWLSQTTLEDDPSLCELPEEIFNKTHDNQYDYLKGIFDSLVQGFSHLNEYRLLKDFADVDLIAAESLLLNILGYLIIGISFYSAFVTFNSAAKPKFTDFEMYETLKKEFLFFTKKPREFPIAIKIADNWDQDHKVNSCEQTPLLPSRTPFYGGLSL